MEMTLNRDVLLPALQVVAPAIETKQTLPILSNVLWTVQGEILTLLGTDLEIELTASVPLDEPLGEFVTSIPARKLLDIVRSLPGGEAIQFRFTNKQCQIVTQQNRFVLSTLPADNYPRLKSEAGDVEFLVKQADFLQLLQTTYFAMAVADVRYYLNGLYLSVQPGGITAIATDGHRLAHCEVKTNLHEGIPDTAFLLPRNAVVELIRLLEDEDSMLTVTVAKGHCRLATETFTFASKLIEGRVPDYKRAIPQQGNRVWTLNREAFKAALSRVVLVVSDKNKGVRLTSSESVLQLHTYDAETGEAEAKLDGEFVGEPVVVGLNGNYLLDVINALHCEQLQLFFTDSNAPAYIVGDGIEDRFYVIMPMRV